MHKKIIILGVLITLLLASCGGGGPSTTLNVTLTDFAFVPNTFTVPTGQEITLNITNNGAVVHNFVIMKLGKTAGDTFNEEDDPNVYWQERDIPSDGELSVKFTAPTEPGEYQIVCRTPGHVASGMIGKLTVVAEEQ